MVLLSLPYVVWLDRYLVEPRDHAWHFGAMLIGREPWELGEVKRHWRAWIIKGFFIAFMLSILPGGFAAVVETDFGAIAGDPVRLGSALFELLFVVDVQIGTVGYLLTLRPLDAHIRSGNPLLAGWLAALLCYPPFVYTLMGPNGVIHYEYQTAGWGYWLAGHDAVLWLWAGGLVLLTAVYAWATMAFGIRFSNLTYRGVLTHGPYRLTRHPAYLSKNLFWWLSTLPFLVTTGSLLEAVRNFVLLGVLSSIYFWRAKTEEAHLLAEDAKYREYHAWMAAHGPITAPLTRALSWARPRRHEVQPAE
jgi:protein-S-isoprenylcysteine O-methyltransferase Ste14